MMDNGLKCLILIDTIIPVAAIMVGTGGEWEFIQGEMHAFVVLRTSHQTCSSSLPRGQWQANPFKHWSLCRCG